ncbi:hypothetical protein GUJ93_ZPchr0012g21369 [Zizania palustris]|uniref:Uncharacterized protein n=1 Tax=Zizania palustris TaxID=103762 RepID=A0A8J6BU86_ZIZPA|nr:hypothetical protein GUJ93_ZPchr0012g21369 [Zizania palustris]
MSNTTGGEHTQTQAQTLPLLEGAGGGKVKVKVGSPEKVLNGFVWLVAVLERLGNAMGTLAFTWATVILLGGYPAVLRSKSDFLYAIIIVFMEALRMFSRGNRKDYDLFFSTRGAFTLVGLTGLLTAILYFSTVLLILRYVFMRELTTMIHDDNYKYTAASLLGNMCEHARHKLSNSDLNDLCHTLREVLEGIMDAEGAELEVLISLSSQICRAIPEDFARELDYGQIKERFVERLVTVLHANMRPCAHCPSIRRVIVEHAIHLIECNSRYANDFDKYWMAEALSMVERTPSMAENYRLLSGDAGFMEHRTPLYTLVARAKELMNREWVRGISTIT